MYRIIYYKLFSNRWALVFYIFFTSLTPSMAQKALSSLIAFCVFDSV